MLSSRPSPVVPANGARSGARGRSSHSRQTANGRGRARAATVRAPRRVVEVRRCARPAPAAPAPSSASTSASASTRRPRRSSSKSAVAAAAHAARSAERRGRRPPPRRCRGKRRTAPERRAENGSARDVEDQPLGVAHEVEVEHHEQLGRRHLAPRVEERVREHIEQHAARALGEARASRGSRAAVSPSKRA